MQVPIAVEIGHHRQSTTAYCFVTKALITGFDADLRSFRKGWYEASPHGQQSCGERALQAVQPAWPPLRTRCSVPGTPCSSFGRSVPPHQAHYPSGGNSRPCSDRRPCLLVELAIAALEGPFLPPCDRRTRRPRPTRGPLRRRRPQFLSRPPKLPPSPAAAAAAAARGRMGGTRVTAGSQERTAREAEDAHFKAEACRTSSPYRGFERANTFLVLLFSLSAPDITT